MATTIFREDTDHPQDIAEDVTREAMQVMALPGFAERLYGKVDYKKAIYAFTPAPHPVALMLDAKAEKHNGDRTATIQMSQTSMRVRLMRRNQPLDEPGGLEPIIKRNNRRLTVVTIIAKFIYTETTARQLYQIVLACIPNGQLQNTYNPTATDTIWRVGRDAPTLGEDFRVRLHYDDLRKKAAWRVTTLNIPNNS